jgi:hypothetical protein
LNKKIIGVIAIIIIGIIITLIVTSGITSNNKNIPINAIDTKQTSIEESTPPQGKNYTISLQDGINTSSTP